MPLFFLSKYRETPCRLNPSFFHSLEWLLLPLICLNYEATCLWKRNNVYKKSKSKNTDMEIICFQLHGIWEEDGDRSRKQVVRYVHQRFKNQVEGEDKITGVLPSFRLGFWKEKSQKGIICMNKRCLMRTKFYVPPSKWEPHEENRIVAEK